MQTCIWPSGFHCHLLSLASVKSRLVLPFWYQLTWVVPEKWPLNVCVCVNSVTCALFVIDVMCMSCGLIRSEVFEHSCQITAAFNCLQCFDTVGWVSGSAYGL